MSKVQVNKVDKRVFNKAALRLLAMSGLSFFIAAPTPGHVGGCGGGVSNAPLVVPMGETAEYSYFDRAVCAGFCQRLLDCRVLCTILVNPPGGTVDSCNQQSNQQAAYELCMRGSSQLDGAGPWQVNRFPIGGGGYLTECPHACPSGSFQANSVVEGDVASCNDAMQALSCNAVGVGSIGEAFNSTTTPLACANRNICR